MATPTTDCTILGQPLLEIFVPGRPAPQGSKSPVGTSKDGHVLMAESSKAVGPWRDRIAYFASRAYRGGLLEATVPVVLLLDFVFPRVTGTPKRKPPPPMVQTPDLDKLCRAVADALAGVVYANDSAIVSTVAHKRRAELDEPYGVRIVVATQAAVDARWAQRDGPHPAASRAQDGASSGGGAA